jgi:hypothetical protein
LRPDTLEKPALDGGDNLARLLKENVPGHDLLISSDKYAGPLKYIAQLADVSRPVVPLECFKRSRS